MSGDAKRVLVPVDGFQPSLDAVGYTADLFPPHRTEVVLFHVFSQVPESLYDLGSGPSFQEALRSLTGWEMRLRESIERFMEKARGLLLEAGFPESAVSVSIPDLQSGIARDIFAESHGGYHAVVAGRTGADKLQGLVLGGVAKKLLDRMDHLPLCLVGGRTHPESLLLALDGSEGSFRAVEFTASILPRVSGVVLFHALRGFDIYERGQNGSAAEDHNRKWLERYDVESAFDRAGKRLSAAGIDPSSVSTRFVKGVTSRSGAIVGEAREGSLGTLVLGRRGHSDVPDFSIGRVADKVIQLARDRAVWIVP